MANDARAEWKIPFPALTGSLLASAGIAVPHLWFAAPAGLCLFLLALFSDRSNWRQHLRWSLIFGTMTGGAGTLWMWNTLPLDFLGIRNPAVQWVAVGMTWLYITFSLGLPVAAFAPLARMTRRFVWHPVAVGLLWMLCEKARMWGFALATWSPDLPLGAHFSVSAIGYPLTETGILRQLANPFGVDGLNFVTAWAAASIAALPAAEWRGGWLKATAVQAAVVAVSWTATGLVNARPSANTAGRPLRFAIIATNHFDVREQETHVFLKEQLAAAARAQPPVDVVALPEEFGLTSIFWSAAEARQFLDEHFGGRDVLILNTRNELYPAEEKNLDPERKKLCYDSTRSGEIGRYEKRNLMPLGEYAPAFTRTFFSPIRDPDLCLHIDGVQEMGRALSQKSIPVVRFNGTGIGGLLCSDIISPSLYAEMAGSADPCVLVNLANPFWFHGSRLLHWKVLQISRVHAVRHRLPFVLANNTAPSFVLDPRGNITLQTDWGTSSPVFVSLP